MFYIDNNNVVWRVYTAEDGWRQNVERWDFPVPSDATVYKIDYDGKDLNSLDIKHSGLQVYKKDYNMRVVSNQVTYELSLTELKEIFAEKLNVSSSKISVSFEQKVNDEHGYALNPEVIAVKVVVNNT